MNEAKRISRDGLLSALSGVDSSRSPSLIAQDQLAFAGNISVRDGYPTTRSRFGQRPFYSPSEEIAEWIASHEIQGAAVFTPRYGDAVLVASIGGRIFQISPLSGFAVKEITPTLITTTAANFTTPNVGSSVTVLVTNPTTVHAGYPIIINGSRYMVDSMAGPTLTVTNLDAPLGVVTSGATVVAIDPNSAGNPRAWFQQAELFLIIQDGQRRPIIYDGTKSFRSRIEDKQVPVGTVMAYGKGRLWVAVNKNEFAAGDIALGQAHDPQYNKLDSVLYFTENTFLASGGNFSIPIQSGSITAMVFMAVLDTSTGNGPLLVFTEKAVFSCDASEDRDSWANTRSPIKTIVVVGSGAVGQYAVAQTTNSDIFYRARDGVRSFYLAMRQFTNSWGNTPNSTEMDRVLPFDDPLLIKYGSMIQFDNRLLFTVQPMPTTVNAYHRAIGVLDFNLISSMRGKAPPVYEGIWTGFQPILLFKGDIGGKERAFAWGRSAEGDNELWEYDKASGYDNNSSRVQSFFETRAMFGREPSASPLSLKRIESAEIYVDSIKGEVDFTLYYRPDQYPCWVEWGREQSVCSVYENCATEESCEVATVKRPTFKTRLNFGQPPDEDQAVDDKPARCGYEFQLRLEWTGHARVRKVLLRMTELDDAHFPTVE